MMGSQEGRPPRGSVPRNAMLVAGWILSLSSGAGLAKDLSGTELKVPAHFMAPSSDKHGKPRGVSGMACLGQDADPTRECLVVNDEERFGEIALLTSDELKPTGRLVEFTRKGEKGEGVVGAIPKPKCDGAEAGKFGELDGEGVALAGGYLYVAGSHACSRDGGFEPSRYLLTRFKVSGADIPSGADAKVERSWRLSDALIASVGDAYGKKKEAGTNIEGIAVIDGTLYAGLRTPSDDAGAFIVAAPVADLFPDETAPPKGDPVLHNPIRVLLGPNAGSRSVRDLAALRSGGLLILSGPTLDQPEIGYDLWLLAKPGSGAAPEHLTSITTERAGADGQPAKAETVAILNETETNITVIIMYDNIDEGAPTRYEISLPAH
jgi:hypothetical protein